MATPAAKTQTSTVSSQPKKWLTFDEIMATPVDKPVTFYSADKVNEWMKKASDIGKRASNYYGDGTRWVAPNTQLVEELDGYLKEESKIRHYFQTNRDTFQDPDKMMKELDTFFQNLSNLRDSTKQANSVFSKYKNEQEYKEGQEAAAVYQRRATMDLEGTAGAFLQKEDLVKRQLDFNAAYEQARQEKEQAMRDAPKSTLIGTSKHNDAYYKEASKTNLDKSLANLAQLDPNSQEYRNMQGTAVLRLFEQQKVINDELQRLGYSDYESFKEAFDEEKRERAVAAYTQKGIAVHKDATEAEDFAEKSKYDPGVKDVVYRFINGESLASNIMDELPPLLKSIRQYMEPNEIAVYNYYYTKRGKDAADAYLDIVEDTLSTRKADELFKNLENHWLKEQAFGAIAGVDSFVSGLKNNFNDSEYYIPPSAIQKTSKSVREDLYGDGGFGGVVSRGLYDTINSTYNMAPSVLASAATTYLTTKATGSPELGMKAGKTVGQLLMGASARGNAYAQAINTGYTKEQAHLYATLVAGSEICLEKALSGIPQLGGNVTSKVVKAVDSVDNAFARVALKFGTHMVSEGVEEGLQEMLTPVFQHIATGEHDAIDWGGVAESFVIGGLVGGLYGGGSVVKNEIRRNGIGEAILKTNALDGLLAFASTLSPDSDAVRLSETITPDSGTYRIGELFDAVCEEADIRDAVGQMKTEVINEITPEVKREMAMMDMGDDVSRQITKQRAVDNAPPHVAEPLQQLMDMLDEYYPLTYRHNSSLPFQLEATPMESEASIPKTSRVDYDSIAKYMTASNTMPQYNNLLFSSSDMSLPYTPVTMPYNQQEITIPQNDKSLVFTKQQGEKPGFTPNNAEYSERNEIDRQTNLEYTESVDYPVKTEQYEDVSERPDVAQKEQANKNVKPSPEYLLFPKQMHHFATNKNKKYTPHFEMIAAKYGLDLDEDWNKEKMHHLGRHPNEYHDWILKMLYKSDAIAQRSIAQDKTKVFLDEFEKAKQFIRDNPILLRKKGWKDREILLDDVQS